MEVLFVQGEVQRCCHLRQDNWRESLSEQHHLSELNKCPRGDPIDVHSAGQPACIKGIPIVSRRSALVNQDGDLLTEQIIHYQFEITGYWQLTADDCFRIERVGIILV